MNLHRVLALILIAAVVYAVVDVVDRFRLNEMTRVRALAELAACGFLLTVFSWALLAEQVG